VATGQRNQQIAYSYIRFSHPDQARGDSLRRQLAITREYCVTNNLSLDEKFTIRDLGISAFRGKNATKGALGAFLNAVQAGRVPKGSALLIESLDRLSRNEVEESYDLLRDIMRGGIEVHTLSDNQIYRRGEFSMQQMIWSLFVLARAHEESQRKSERIGAAWKMKKGKARLNKTPITWRVPAWIQVVDGRYHLIPERASLIRRIFKLSADGLGKRSIAVQLNREGIQTWGDRARKPANGWHDSYIQKILHNPAVIGVYQPYSRGDKGRVPDGEPIEDYFPAAVDFAVWQKVNARHVAGRTTAGARTNNLFTGIAKDGYTGAVMRFVDKGPRGKGKWKYLVSDQARIVPGSAKSTWNYLDFESLFLRFVREIDWSAISGVSESAEVEELEMQSGSLFHEETKAKEALNNVIKAIEAGPGIQTLVVRASELESKLQILAEERLVVQKRLELLRAQRCLAEREKLDVHQLVERLRDPISRVRLREEIRSKVEKVELFPKGLAQSTISGVTDFLKLLSEAGRASKLANLSTAPAFLVSFKSGARRLVVRLIDISSDLLMVLDPDEELSPVLLAESATDREIIIT
jgi:DNA invertase Pin-like site-specific DNA recombinase